MRVASSYSLLAAGPVASGSSQQPWGPAGRRASRQRRSTTRQAVPGTWTPDLGGAGPLTRKKYIIFAILAVNLDCSSLDSKCDYVSDFLFTRAEVALAALARQPVASLVREAPLREYCSGGACREVGEVRPGMATRVTSRGSCFSLVGQLPVLARYWCGAALLEGQSWVGRSPRLAIIEPESGWEWPRAGRT